MIEKDQHLLINKEIVDREIETAELSSKDKVIEIGAGEGILTEKLAEKCEVLAFEVDEKFKNKLSLIKNKNLKVVYGNALDYSWMGYDKIVSNIPYTLSEAIVMKAINDYIQELTLIVSENFKETLLASETKLGIVAKIFFDIEEIEKIGKENFNPSPAVDSFLIKIERKKESLMQNILLYDGKVKNAIIYSFVKKGKTKNEAREIITKLKINFLEKYVKKLTANNLVSLMKELKSC